MGALKAVVVILGMLIFATAGMIGYELYRRADKVAPPAAANAPGQYALPKGARLEDVSVSGDRVLLRIVLDDGRLRLVVLDLARGALPVGSIDIERGP